MKYIGQCLVTFLDHTNRPDLISKNLAYWYGPKKLPTNIRYKSWLILIFFPQAKICKIFAISIFPIFVLSFIYCYLIYHIFQYGYDFSINFRLYLGLNELSDLFSNSSFLILFWIHFLSINLYLLSFDDSDLLFTS